MRLRARPAPRISPDTDLSVPGPRPRVLVLGAGFGGLAAALRLARAAEPAQELEIVLVDRNNYHLFSPLLYQVAAGLVDPMSITHPIRAIARDVGIRFLLAEVQDFELDAKRVVTDVGAVAYDYLIIAMGSVTNFY